ncbi:MAG: M23 family metallopeptidase [Candidatus Riflebacteria bacterium]|nr:M23 family metallopeptidase [Candidatus Riflebacteria bacterium]
MKDNIRIALGSVLLSLLSLLPCEARDISFGRIPSKPDSISTKKTNVADCVFFDTLSPVLSPADSVKTFAVNTKSKVNYARADNYEIIKRLLHRPLYGRITSNFGYRFHPKRQKRHFHTGLDIAALRGTPIVATLEGTVKFAGWMKGYGNVVIIEHQKGIQTVYAHCSKLAVKKGQTVTTKQVIGYVGMTGVATGNHLHFEVRKNGKAQNPFLYLKY